MDSTGNRSLGKRVARWNCFKSHIYQLNGKATYGDKPKNDKDADNVKAVNSSEKEETISNVVYLDFSKEGEAVSRTAAAA